MTEQELLRAVGEIDEKYILDADPSKAAGESRMSGFHRKMSRYRAIGSLLAAGLVLAAGLGFYQLIQRDSLSRQETSAPTSAEYEMADEAASLPESKEETAREKQRGDEAVPIKPYEAYESAGEAAPALAYEVNESADEAEEEPAQAAGFASEADSGKNEQTLSTSEQESSQTDEQAVVNDNGQAALNAAEQGAAKKGEEGWGFMLEDSTLYKILWGFLSMLILAGFLR